MKTMKDQKGGAGAKALIIAVIIIIAAAGFYLMMPGGAKSTGRARADANAYIDAMQKRDFEIIFRYDGISQRRKAIINQRAEGDKEKEIKELFLEQKSSFENAQPSGDLGSQWAEKFIFTPGASLRIASVEMVQDTENPSQPSSDRQNALVTIEAGYPEKASAPDLGGKVKEAVFQITMVESKNISRLLRSDTKEHRWLILSLAVKQSSIKYWQ